MAQKKASKSLSTIMGNESIANSFIDANKSAIETRNKLVQFILRGRSSVFQCKLKGNVCKKISNC